VFSFRIFFRLLLLVVVPMAEGRSESALPSDPPADYYAAAEGLLGDGLKAALHQRIRGHRVLSYGSRGTVPAMRVLDAMPGDPTRVRLLYWGTGRSILDYGGNVGDWNHEHTWPQVYGVDTGPGNSDLHHLRPCDVQANGERGSLYFAEIVGGSTPLRAPLCRKTAVAWMPRPEEKGDLARAMFYMAVRYEGGEATPDLELSDTPNAGANRFGKLSDLLRWHREDPVNEEERWRNDLIYTDYQFNRNPFIDDPDYAEMVFAGVPVVRVTAVQPEATEGGEPAVVRISRRGPLQGALTVGLSYSGTAGSAAWQEAPASVALPAGRAAVDLTLTPRSQPGEQGARTLLVAAATNPAYAPVSAAEITLLDAPDVGYEIWSGGQTLSSAGILAYAVGGASSPDALDGLPVSHTVTSSSLSMTAIVRTNDPKLTVVGQVVGDLSGGPWNTNHVTMTPGDQAGVGEGLQRQIWSTPRGSASQKYIRLEVVLQP
jgi:Endonuclease I